MINATEKKNKRRPFHSLYLQLVVIIGAATLAAVLIYALLRAGSNYYINNYYITDEGRSEREEEYIANLQSFVDKNDLSSEDTDRIAGFAKSHKYVYLLLYRDNELFFSSDMIPDAENKDAQNPEDNTEGDSAQDGSQADTGSGDGSKEDDGIGDIFGSGITVDYPTREELKQYAQENDFYELELSDGILFASVAEFSEYFYYDVFNITGLLVAMLALALIIILYFKTVISRIKKLEREVMIVAGGNINRPILSGGYDEISRLSRNVENMRCAILESTREEREAREANTELITAMSHDIRTPLTVLLGYLDIMKECAESEQMRTYVSASEQTAMRLKNLSDDMFNYSLAFGNTKENIKPKSYDALTLVDQMLSEHILLLSENGYTVKLDRTEQPVRDGATITTDAPKLMRIIDNIFSNIYKYSDKSSPVLFKIDIGAERVVFEARNRISENRSEAESNGIGLKTCKRLAPFVAEDLFAGERDGSFVVRLSLKIDMPEEAYDAEL